MLSINLFIATLIASSIATPLVIRQAPTLLPWQVTDYCPGCGTSPAGCADHFNIAFTAPDRTDEPPFNTYCHGSNIQNSQQQCDDPSILQWEVPTFEGDVLQVTHAYYFNGAHYNVTGNYTVTDFETCPQSFEIQPYGFTASA